jgi:transposase InsO family protein
MLSADYPLTWLCDLLDCRRSSYYYQPEPPPGAASEHADESEERAAIEAIAARWPTYGYRRVTAQLHRQGIAANHKRVRRLMGEMGLQVFHKRRKSRTTDSEHPFPRYPNLVRGLEVVRPDQVWVSDITYICLPRDFVYLAVIMDVFTRCIRGWHLARSLDRSLTVTALRRALVHHTPEVHHSDQGVQYAATLYTEMLKNAGALISMAEVGEAWQNGYAERLIRTIREEEIALTEYQDYAHALQQIGCFPDDVYMHKRIHSALGYLTPVEFEGQWLYRQAAELVVI